MDGATSTATLELPTEVSSHDRILRAARSLFASEGYEGTTTSAIARQAGTSESQLIKHFGSKEGLLQAIFDLSWQRMELVLRQVLEPIASPIERLKALSETLVHALDGDGDMRTLMLLEGRRIRKHGHMVVLTRGFLQLVRVIDDLLREMRATGQLRADLDIEAVRSALVGAIEGMLRDRLLAERAMSYPASYGVAEMNAVFLAVLDGLLVCKPPGGGKAAAR
jgi:AcrR family transcriptional regulator